MKIEEFKTFEYDCQDTQELLLLYVLYPEELTIDEQSDVNEHINNCAVCREELENLKWGADVFGADQEYWINSGIFGDVQSDQPAVQMSHEEIMEQRFHDRLNRAGNRRKRRERKEKIANIKRLIKPISAVAACLVVGLGLVWAVTQYSNDGNSSPTIASNQYQPPVKIELILDKSTEVIPAGQTIAAGDALKTLRINGNRQMVLNIGTQLSIEPRNLGCVVKLDKGEIYTEVEHDGKPFMVETSYGRAVITGTTFNIKADSDKMDLAVVEGSVCFESEKGSVDVAGGYQSSIAADMKPSIPVTCDATQIARWAKGSEADGAIEVNQPDIYFSKMLDLPVTFIPYCDLEDINFDVWINQHREWFEREFPWTKRLQMLLAQDGIEVDTIDLLIESGDLWRFFWPEYNQHRILAEDPKLIKKLADQYGIEIENLFSIKAPAQIKQVSNNEALEKWLEAIERGEKSLTIDSIHAAVFLVNTRSLAWFAVKSDKIQVENKQRVLDLLTEQVKIASNSLEILTQLLLANKDKSACSTAQYDELIRNLNSDLLLIMKIERKITEYEIIYKWQL